MQLLDGAEWEADHCYATKPTDDGKFLALFKRNGVRIEVEPFQDWDTRQVSHCVAHTRTRARRYRRH